MIYASDILGRKWENRNTYFNNYAKHLVDRALQRAESRGHKEQFSFDTIHKWELQFAGIGGKMEETTKMLKLVNDEVIKSKQLMQDTAKKLGKTWDIVLPQMIEMVREIRNKRMSITIEMNKSLNTMQDVRKFFLESDYNVEMERLERFVVLGERMKKLMDDGTLDALVEVAIKLGLGKGAE